MTKWGVHKLFETMQMVASTRATLQVTSELLVMFQEKIRQGAEKYKNIAKTAKNEGCNTRFPTFPGSELRTPKDAT